jgi:hypothetical protein
LLEDGRLTQILNRHALALYALDGDSTAPLILADLLEEEGEVCLASLLRQRSQETNDAVGVALCVLPLRDSVRVACNLLTDHLGRQGDAQKDKYRTHPVERARRQRDRARLLEGLVQHLEHIRRWTVSPVIHPSLLEHIVELERLASNGSARTADYAPYTDVGLSRASREAVARFVGAVRILRKLDEAARFQSTPSREAADCWCALASMAQHLQEASEIVRPDDGEATNRLNDESNWQRGRVRRELLGLGRSD